MAGEQVGGAAGAAGSAGVTSSVVGSVIAAVVGAALAVVAAFGVVASQNNVAGDNSNNPLVTYGNESQTSNP